MLNEIDIARIYVEGSSIFAENFYLVMDSFPLWPPEAGVGFGAAGNGGSLGNANARLRLVAVEAGVQVISVFTEIFNLLVDSLLLWPPEAGVGSGAAGDGGSLGKANA